MLVRALIGLGAGLLATACMTVWELLLWRRWGLEAALDWHVNQCALSRLNRRPPEQNLAAGLLLHAVVGSAAGALYVALLCAHPFLAAAIWTGPGLGVLLWLLLLGLRKPLTGLAPFAGRLRAWPALGSLAGHVIYGLVLAAACSHIELMSSPNHRPIMRNSGAAATVALGLARTLGRRPGWHPTGNDCCCWLAPW